MERKNSRARRGWVIALAGLTLSGLLTASQAALADGDKGKEPKVPIIIGKPIIKPDTPPKKK